MWNGFNIEMISQPYDYNEKEVIDLETLSKAVLDFTKWWIERKLEKLVALTNGFKYRFLGHQLLRDERWRQIFEGLIEEIRTPSEDVGIKKWKEVSQQKNPRIDEVV